MDQSNLASVQFSLCGFLMPAVKNKLEELEEHKVERREANLQLKSCMKHISPELRK